MFDCDWETLSMPKGNDLLSRCCHVSSIVGKFALFCAFLNDDSMPKDSSVMVFFQLTSACETSAWLSEISSKLFQDVFCFQLKILTSHALYEITTRNKQRILF